MTLDLLPCAWHPTTILLVDDDTDRARVLARQLVSLNCRVVAFNRPEAVLRYLREEYQPQPFTNAWGHPPEEETCEIVSQLHQQIYSSTRLNQLAILVTDHDMKPDIDGLELCRSVPYTSIRKILWTTVLKADPAADALSEGLITGYVFQNEGSAEEAVAKLKHYIRKALREHFLALSSFLRKADNYCPEYKTLGDPVFVQFFQEQLEKLDIVEYWLFDSTGSFVLLDAQGRDYALFARDADGMTASYDCEEFNSAPKKIQQQLRSNSHMLCLPDIGGRFPPGSEWTPYVHPASKLEGKHGTYFYHLGERLLDLDRKKIVAFDAYRRQHRSVVHRFE